jgi:pyrroloquinoline-quinone synthase
MSSRIDELDAIVAQFDLNEHPFYQAWRAGTLPIERLREYATEWAPFIGVLDAG